MSSIQLESALVNQEHRNASAIFRVKPDLLDLEVVALNRRFQSSPLGLSMAGHLVAVNRGRDRIRAELDERFFALPVSDNPGNRTESRKLELASWLTIHVEQLDL